MPLKLIHLYTSFKGRLPRSTFWGALIAIVLLFAMLFVFLESAFGRSSTWILYPPFWWAAATLSVKRLHDRAQSAWRLLLLLIPVVGPLWWVVTLGVRAGTRGDNQYGPDPLTEGVDYLVVGSEP